MSLPTCSQIRSTSDYETVIFDEVPYVTPDHLRHTLAVTGGDREFFGIWVVAANRKVPGGDRSAGSGDAAPNRSQPRMSAGER